MEEEGGGGAALIFASRSVDLHTKSTKAPLHGSGGHFPPSCSPRITSLISATQVQLRRLSLPQILARGMATGPLL